MEENEGRKEVKQKKMKKINEIRERERGMERKSRKERRQANCGEKDLTKQKEDKEITYRNER